MSDMATLTQEMVFEDLEPIRVPVRIAGKSYFLQEPTADAVLKFRGATTRGARMIDGRVEVPIDGVREAEPLLVSLCLCETDKEGKVRLDTGQNPVTVPIQKVRMWPHKVVSKLFDRCVEMCPDLVPQATKEALEKQLRDVQEKLKKFGPNGDATAEDLAKNEHGPTTPSSA
jgi:hypothetical protein